MPPFVSVLVPNYNHQQFLAQRIESILNQTYANFELILLDDGSTDDSLDVLKKYEQHEKVVRVWVNPANSGSPFGLWPKGLELARGGLVWIAESDDWADPTFLERLVPGFEDPEVVVAHCRSYNHVNGKNKLNQWWASFGLGKWEQDYVESGTELIDLYGKYKCPVMNVSSALIRKSAIDQNLFPIPYRYCGDWWFWLKLFQKGKVSFVAQPLNYLRIHKGSAIRKKRSSQLPRIRENESLVLAMAAEQGTQLKYHKNYDWLLQSWVAAMMAEGRYFDFGYLRSNLPGAFKRKLWSLYASQLFATLGGKIFKSG